MLCIFEEMSSILRECIKISPSILWFVLATILIAKLYRPVREDLLPRIGVFKAMGIEISLVRSSLEAALELAEKSPQWKVEVPPADKERALKRAKKHLSLFMAARFLWVDDHPENNINERRMFRNLGVDIDTALGTDEAFQMVRRGSYDLVLSDMARGEKPSGGLDLLVMLANANIRIPVVFYVGVVDPARGVPAWASGITNRPDELLHFTLDALERVRC